MNRKFAAVHFVGTDQVEAVPLHWLHSDGSTTLCAWPAGKLYSSTRQISSAISDMHSIKEDWEEYASTIIHKCDTLVHAKQVCNKYCVDSDVGQSNTESETEQKKSRKNRKAIRPESDDESPIKRGPAKKLCFEKDVNAGPQSAEFILPPPPQPLLVRKSAAKVSSTFYKAQKVNPKRPTVLTSEQEPIPLASSPCLTASPRHSPSEANPQHPPAAACTRRSPAAASPQHSSAAAIARHSPTAASPRHSPSVANIQHSPAAASPRRSPAAANPRHSPAAAIARRSPAAASAQRSTLTPRHSAAMASLVTRRTVSVVDRRTITLLEEIKSQGQTQILLLQQLLQNNSTSGRLQDMDAQDDFSLPFSHLDQLEKMESDCRDRDIRAKLTRYLALSGGSSVADTTRNFLKRLMTSSVALKCNWKGKGGKFAFAKGNLKEVICDAVRRNPSTTRAVDSEVHKFLKDWLRFAADREGGRQRRAARKAQQNIAN